MRLKLLLLLNIIFPILIIGQNTTNFELVEDSIQNFKPEIQEILENKNIVILGYYQDALLICVKEKDNSIKNGTDQFFLLDEINFSIKQIQVETSINKSIAIKSITLDEYILSFGYWNESGNFDNISLDSIDIDSREYNYQDMWLFKKNENILIDKFAHNYIDKKLRCQFSFEGDRLICNSYTNSSPNYSENEDNQIFIYDISEFSNNKVSKTLINCDRCKNSYISKDKIIFNKEIPMGAGYDGYFNNIYEASLNNIKDTVKLAHNMEISLFSDDGEFILGMKRLFGKTTPYILSTSKKSYQYLIGLQYENYFYSKTYKKFAFIKADKIVYINYPKNFPFNALDKKRQKSSTEDNKVFWEKFK